MMPTAGAVLGDLYTLVNGHRVRSALAEQRLDLPILDRYAVRGRFYLRMMVQDRPGVIARVGAVLADHGISIASVVQKEQTEDPARSVPLVFITHETTVGAVGAAVEVINREPVTLEPTHIIRIMDVL